MRQIQVEYVLSYGAPISKELLRKITDIVRANLAPLSALLTTVGVGMLLPSLAVVIVNAIGFTSGGVLAGARAVARIFFFEICMLILFVVVLPDGEVGQCRSDYPIALLRPVDGRRLLNPAGIRCDGGDFAGRGIGSGRDSAWSWSRPLWVVVV